MQDTQGWLSNAGRGEHTPSSVLLFGRPALSPLLRERRALGWVLGDERPATSSPSQGCMESLRGNTQWLWGQKGGREGRQRWIRRGGKSTEKAAFASSFTLDVKCITKSI